MVKYEHVHVIYPKKVIKQNRSRWIKNLEKYAEVHCSTVASLLAEYKTGRRWGEEEGESKKERIERHPCPENFFFYSHLIGQWVTHS